MKMAKMLLYQGFCDVDPRKNAEFHRHTTGLF